jgi:hypothetical protein
VADRAGEDVDQWTTVTQVGSMPLTLTATPSITSEVLTTSTSRVS